MISRLFFNNANPLNSESSLEDTKMETIPSSSLNMEDVTEIVEENDSGLEGENERSFNSFASSKKRQYPEDQDQGEDQPLKKSTFSKIVNDVEQGIPLFEEDFVTRYGVNNLKDLFDRMEAFLQNPKAFEHFKNGNFTLGGSLLRYICNPETGHCANCIIAPMGDCIHSALSMIDRLSDYIQRGCGISMDMSFIQTNVINVIESALEVLENTGANGAKNATMVFSFPLCHPELMDVLHRIKHPERRFDNMIRINVMARKHDLEKLTTLDTKTTSNLRFRDRMSSYFTEAYGSSSNFEMTSASLLLDTIKQVHAMTGAIALNNLDEMLKLPISEGEYKEGLMITSLNVCNEISIPINTNACFARKACRAKTSIPRIGYCVLGAVNLANLSTKEEIQEVAECVVEILTNPNFHVKEDVEKYGMSIGVSTMGLGLLNEEEALKRAKILFTLLKQIKKNNRYITRIGTQAPLQSLSKLYRMGISFLPPLDYEITFSAGNNKIVSTQKKSERGTIISSYTAEQQLAFTTQFVALYKDILGDQSISIMFFLASRNIMIRSKFLDRVINIAITNGWVNIIYYLTSVGKGTDEEEGNLLQPMCSFNCSSNSCTTCD